MTATGQPNSSVKIICLAGHDIAFDGEGFFMDDTQWKEDVCRVLAARCGLTKMQKEHWQVLYAYRKFYDHHGRAPLNRELKKATGMTIMAMERLFPGGLKLGARRLCGLPNPKTCQ